MLLQEWVGLAGPQIHVAESFSKGRLSVGTAISSSYGLDRKDVVLSPHADLRAQFWKGRVRKATAIAQTSGITFVSFHGYNGWPRHDVKKLMDHVRKVLGVVVIGPVVFAGDFNTFTTDHHRALVKLMNDYGYSCDISVPYDKKKTLDLVFTRGCTARMVAVGHHESDHPYMLMDVTV